MPCKGCWLVKTAGNNLQSPAGFQSLFVTTIIKQFAYIYWSGQLPQHQHPITFPPGIKMSILQCQSLVNSQGKADIYPEMPYDCEPVYSKIIGRIWQSAEITIRLIPVFPRVVTGPLLFSGVMTRDPLSISNIITMTCLQLPSSNTGPATLQSIRKICLI